MLLLPVYCLALLAGKAGKRIYRAIDPEEKPGRTPQQVQEIRQYKAREDGQWWNCCCWFGCLILVLAGILIAALLLSASGM